jgi:hypothetical protein
MGSTPSKMPEDIYLNQDHVSYAFAVLKGKFHDKPAEVCFEDSDCPAGRVYIVKITWEKPRPGGAGVGAIPDRVCRGSTWQQATRLSSAIAAAALHIDQRFPPEIQSEELHELICTVALIRRHKDIVPVGQLATSTMCLSLVEPNPEQPVPHNLDQVVFHAMSLKESYGPLTRASDQNLTRVLEQAGYLRYDDAESFGKAEGDFHLWYISTTCAELSYTEWRAHVDNLDAQGPRFSDMEGSLLTL